MKKLLNVSSVVIIVVGIIMIGGGLWGMCFTYRNVNAEKIVTPKDAAIAEAPVRGPLTLKVQADVIRKHVLETTGGKTFAEMPRTIPKLDADGNAVLDEKGAPVMVPNTSRDIWITATTLITALNLAIMGYALSVFALLLGLIFILIGSVFCALSRRNL